jgi:hypothetical protein
MARGGVRIPIMGRKQKPPADGPKKGQGRSPFYQVYVRIRPDLGVAFERYLATLRPRSSNTAVVEVMFEEFLASRGFWSPPADQAVPSEEP